MDAESKRFKSTEDTEELRETGVSRGLWPCHVYISIKSAIDTWEGLTKSLVQGAVQIDDPHISLSKPFTLAKHEIEPFLQRLTSSMQGMQPFTTSFALEPVFLTSESNVTFCALKATRGRELLDLMMTSVDECLIKFGQSPYYAERIIHASVATWPSKEDTDLGEAWMDPPVVRVDRIILKAGHNHHEIPLNGK